MKQFIRKSGEKKTHLKTPKKLRRSTRESVVISPDEEKQKAISTLLKGAPTLRARIWSKEQLIDALVTLEGTGRSNEFLKTVIAKRVTSYQTVSAIYKLYRTWKLKKAITPVGRPSMMKIDEAEVAVKSLLTDRSSDSSAFKLKDMKNAYLEKI